MWLNLAHVCRRWGAVMFASCFRLDLNVTVGPIKPGHIETILSGPLPISIRFWFGDVTSSTLWRMRAALRHRDRVREISFASSRINLEEFLSATNHHFPALESLELCSLHNHRLDIPATFLGGPDRPDLRLRCLKLYGVSLSSASAAGLLLSATALTILTLDLTSKATGFDLSLGPFLLARLRDMACLHDLYLVTPEHLQDSQPQHSTPKDIVPLLKLTYSYYLGSSIFLNSFMPGLSTPSLQDALFSLNVIRVPFLYLSRVIDDVREDFRSASVTFNIGQICPSFWTYSGKIDRFKPFFDFDLEFLPETNKTIISTPSTKFAMVEELALKFLTSNVTLLEHAGIFVARISPPVAQRQGAPGGFLYAGGWTLLPAT